MRTVLLKSAVIWASFIPIATMNGLLREKCLAPLLGYRLALPLSGISGAALFFLLTWFSLPWFGPLNPSRCWQIGLAWLGMTLLFEFLFSRLVTRKPWGELLQAYDITTGNLWLLVLLAPFLAARLRGLVP